MKIFISHAVIDKQLAIEFKELIETISLGLTTTWMSSALDGLQPGEILWDEVHENLTTADMIVALLTPNSLVKPWILYESGFVAGNKKSHVIPVMFCSAKKDLPLPLSAYVIYKGDEFEDLKQLLTQIVLKCAPKPNNLIIENGIKEFYNKTQDTINELKEIAKSLKSKESESFRITNKLKASELFQLRLADPSVKNIQIISYTNEVESGTINKYKVKGKKIIEIFKRSIISDLFEQQTTNLRRISNNSSVALWNKFNKLINSTIQIEEEFKNSSDVKIIHYFYDFPPTKRAYIFDNN